MSAVELNVIMSFIQFILTRRVRTMVVDQPYGFAIQHPVRNTELISFEFKLENSIRRESPHLMVVISNYCRAISGKEYTIKISIESRHFVLDGNINRNAPPVTVSLEETIPTHHAEFLSFDQKNNAEEEIASTISKSWEEFFR